jgi:hypothetical protein
VRWYKDKVTNEVKGSVIRMKPSEKEYAAKWKKLRKPKNRLE